MIKIISKKYFCEWANGTSFSSSASDFADHLKGSVGEKLKMVVQIDTALLSQATEAESWWVINGNILERKTGSWIQEGFAIGQSCAMIKDYTGKVGGSGASVEWTQTITKVSDLEIEFNTIPGGPIEKKDHALVCVSKFGALMYNYGIIENSAPNVFKSPYTDDVMAYYYDGINTTTPTEHTMIAVGGQSASYSWKSGDATVKWLSSSDPVSAGVNYAHRYQVTQIFVIDPVFLESYLENLDNGTQPEDLIGQKTLKHISDYEFRYTLSNPNTTVKITDSTTQGAVGWIGENYNGLTHPYSVVVTDYRDTLTDVTCEGLQLKRKTKVSGVITGTGFTNTSKAGAYFFFGAPIASYSDLQDSFQDTFLWDDLIQTMVAGTITGTGTGRIKRFKLDYISATTLTFEIDIQFSSDEIDYINPDDLDPVPDKYFIGIQVGNTSATDTSNKVILQLDWNEFVTSLDVEDLAEFSNQSFYDHGMDMSSGGHTDYKGWLQDGFGYKSTLTLNKTLNANLKSLVVRLIAYNTVTSNEFELQRYAYDLGDLVYIDTVTPPYQQLSELTTRGFKLANSDQFNEVQLNFGAVVGGATQDVEFSLGAKFDWQSWVKLPGADKIFYNASLDSNGLGKDASRYAMRNNYEIKLVVDAGIKQLTEASTRYTDMSNNLDIYGWGLDSEDPARWTTLIEKFNDTDVALGDSILQNGDTKVKITFSPVGGDTSVFPSQWAVHRIDPVLSNGQQAIHELSSFRARPTGNILKPQSGQSFLKITDTGTEIITESVIDYTKLSGGSYNVSGRLGRDITYPRYSIARDIKFLFEDQSEMILLNMPDNGQKVSNSLRHAILDSGGFIQSETAIALDAEDYFAPRLAIDYNHLTNGKPAFYMVCYTGTTTELYEFVYNGTTWLQNKIFSEIIGGSGPTCIRIDAECAPNGKPFIWFANEQSNYNGKTGLIGGYFDGAIWQFGNIETYVSASPLAKHLLNPADVLFHDGLVYLMNSDDGSNPSDDWERGKISVWEQISGSPTDPVDRMNLLGNYTFLYNLYKHTTASIGTDGIGTVGDMAYCVGMELLETDANGNPVILGSFEPDVVAGARHFARIYANIASPTTSAHWTIQTPMAYTNFKFGNPQALRGKASATSQSSPLQRKNQCHVAVVDGNTWITGHQAVGYWSKFIISDWTGVEKNDWYVYTPNDPTYDFTQGNILYE